MRIAELTLAAIIAFAVVYMVYRSGQPKPVKLTSSSNKFTVELTTAPVAPADSVLSIPVKITGDKKSGIKYLIRFAKPNLRNLEHLHRYGTSPLMPVDSAAGLYKGTVSIGNKGTLSHYYFEVRDPVGRYLAGIKLAAEKPLTTLAVGHVDSWIKYGHYATMFIALMAVTFGSLSSLRLLSNKVETSIVSYSFLMAVISFISSAFFLGILLRAQFSGGAWQGAPFGTDLGDNLKQIFLVFLIFVLSGTRKITTKSGAMRTVFPGSALGYLAITSFFTIILAYLGPLVLMFDIPQISTAFYAFLTLLVLVYIIALRLTKNA